MAIGAKKEDRVKVLRVIVAVVAVGVVVAVEEAGVDAEDVVEAEVVVVAEEKVKLVVSIRLGPIVTRVEITAPTAFRDHERVAVKVKRLKERKKAAVSVVYDFQREKWRFNSATVGLAIPDCKLTRASRRLKVTSSKHSVEQAQFQERIRSILPKLTCSAQPGQIAASMRRVTC